MSTKDTSVAVAAHMKEGFASLAHGFGLDSFKDVQALQNSLITLGPRVVVQSHPEKLGASPPAVILSMDCNILNRTVGANCQRNFQYILEQP